LGADFREADLRGVILCGADLMHTSFHKADLRGADLRGADLFQVYLKDAYFDRETRFDPGFDPIFLEMQYLNELVVAIGSEAD
jgi:hypothetical protein